MHLRAFVCFGGGCAPAIRYMILKALPAVKAEDTKSTLLMSQEEVMAQVCANELSGYGSLNVAVADEGAHLGWL